MSTGRRQGKALRRRLLVALTLAGFQVNACADSKPRESQSANPSATDAGGDRDAAPRLKERMVSIELLRTAEHALEQAVDGSFRYGPLTDIGGVEVCVAQQREAFGSFGRFEALQDPICVTSIEGEVVRLRGVPANRDLILTGHKAGYEPFSLTFRTDEHDVDVPPTWGPNITTALVRERATEPWREPKAPLGQDEGIVAIWADATWTGEGSVFGGPQFSTAPYWGLTPAEGVEVAIERADGTPAGSFSTLRERPLFVGLPEGLYRVRFSHPRMNVMPIGLTEQYAICGLSTERQDTIEVPVLAGHVALAIVWVYCAAPQWGQEVEDLATCTLAPTDAGSP